MKKLIIAMALIGLVACDEITTTINNNITAKECRDVLLSWDTPTKREDGTELYMHEIAHYTVEVMESMDEEAYINKKISLGDESVIESLAFAMTDLKTGNQCFKINVTDTNGLTSKWSETVCVDLVECLYKSE